MLYASRASAARRLRPDVSKNSRTALSSKDGEFATSTTTWAPASASARPSPVMVLTPELGDAATTSWPVRRSLFTTFDPIRPAATNNDDFHDLLLRSRSMQHPIDDEDACSGRKALRRPWIVLRLAWNSSMGGDACDFRVKERGTKAHSRRLPLCYQPLAGPGAPARAPISRGRSVELQFLFGDFVLDPDRRELTRASGGSCRSGRRSSTCCSTWCRIASVSSARTNCSTSVWDGRIVSESTLTSHINAVRKAIGDSGEEQRLIRTVARKGFRFVGDVSGSSRLGMPSDHLEGRLASSAVATPAPRWRFPTSLRSPCCRS